MAKYRLTNQAVKDLESIWSFTYKKWSLEQADRYYNLVIDEIEFIAANALSGRSMDHIRQGYRATIVKSHIIFYKISNEKTIEIVRILHQRMDVKNRMK